MVHRKKDGVVVWLWSAVALGYSEDFALREILGSRKCEGLCNQEHDKVELKPRNQTMAHFVSFRAFYAFLRSIISKFHISQSAATICCLTRNYVAIH